ncbi:glycosyltransferase [Puniceicoccaceae bacterium K14]|nr:glycosyltransferase [Puniceicoccaceae bacterium K14]
MNENLKKKVAICVATYNRPKMLRNLLNSLAEMAVPVGIYLELRIVDNDSDGSSNVIVDEYCRTDHPFDDIEYRIQDEQNIALARNTAIAIGPAEAYVFVDDDEVVHTAWLLLLWGAYREYKVDAVFGPVYGICPDEAEEWVLRGNFFNKETPATGTELDWKETRTSNTIVRGNWFHGKNAVRFDPRFGRSGGSDTMLFATMKNIGAKFVACQEAVVFEEVPVERANFKWLWNRWYRNGLVFDRVSKMVGENRFPVLRAAKRIVATVIKLAVAMPAAIVGKPEKALKALLRIPLMFGGVKTWIRKETTFGYVEYKNKSELESNVKTKNVAFLTNIISPYRAPVFKELAATPGWNFKVFVDAENEFDREWKVDRNGFEWKKANTFSLKRIVRNFKPVRFDQTITLHIPYGLVRDLFAQKPDLVISHELGFRTLFAAIYCIIRRVPLVVWAYQSRVSASQGGARLLLRKWLLRRARYALGMGKQAHEVLSGWGVPKARIVDALNAADNRSLRQCQENPRFSYEVDRIKNFYAKNKKLAIVVGRLIPLKGIEQVLHSWKNMSQKTRDEWGLVFVGSGPLAAMIEETSDESIAHVGYVDSKEMSAWYTAADLHIFPSCGDVWGLVVNEASVCGTPSLCSVYAGCYDDLIHEGVDGFGIDFTDSKNSSDYLERVLVRDDLEALGKAAQESIRGFNTVNLANSFRHAAEMAWGGDFEHVVEKSTNVA